MSRSKAGMLAEYGFELPKHIFAQRNYPLVARKWHMLQFTPARLTNGSVEKPLEYDQTDKGV